METLNTKHEIDTIYKNFLKQLKEIDINVIHNIYNFNIEYLKDFKRYNHILSEIKNLQIPFRELNTTESEFIDRILNYLINMLSEEFEKDNLDRIEFLSHMIIFFNDYQKFEYIIANNHIKPKYFLYSKYNIYK